MWSHLANLATAMRATSSQEDPHRGRRPRANSVFYVQGTSWHKNCDFDRSIEFLIHKCRILRWWSGVTRRRYGGKEFEVRYEPCNEKFVGLSILVKRFIRLVVNRRHLMRETISILWNFRLPVLSLNLLGVFNICFFDPRFWGIWRESTAAQSQIRLRDHGFGPLL